MLIDLTKILATEGSTLEESVPFELTHFRRSKREQYKVFGSSPVHLVIRHEKDQVIHITGDASVSFKIPCGRCLKPVDKTFELSFEHQVDVMHPLDDEDEYETGLCIREGKSLDVDQLVHNDILVHWPLRILCREDCKGICPVCGQDLNEGSCTCDEGPKDPRMAAISDLFSKFKEV